MPSWTGSTCQALLTRIDLNEVLDKLDIDLLLERMDINRVLARVDIDAVLASANLDELVARVDLQAVVDRLDLDQIVAKVDLNAALERVDIDALVERTEVGALMARSGIGGDGPDRRHAAQPGRRPRLVRAPLGRPHPAPRQRSHRAGPPPARHAAGGADVTHQLPRLRAQRRDLEGTYAGRGDALRVLRHRLFAIGLLFSLGGARRRVRPVGAAP